MSRLYISYSSELKDILRRFNNEVLKRIIIQQNSENKDALLAEIKEIEQFIEEKQYSSFIERIFKFRLNLFGENQAIFNGSLNLICFLISKIEDPKEQEKAAQIYSKNLLAPENYPFSLLLKFVLSFTCLFNSFEETNPYQLVIFKELFNLLKQEKRLRLIYPFLKTISQSMNKWEMAFNNKVELFETIIKSVMELSQDDEILLLLVQQYFNELEKNNKEISKLPTFFSELVKKLIIQSPETKYDIILKNWKQIQWEFILNSECLKKLKSENSGLFNVFEIIAKKNYKKFSESKKIIEDQLKVNITELDKAIKIASIVNLVEDKTKIKFADIIQSLNISQEELMEFIIVALENKVISGKIDENEEAILIEQNLSKYFEFSDWDSIAKGLEAIQGKFEVYKNSFQSSN